MLDTNNDMLILKTQTCCLNVNMACIEMASYRQDNTFGIMVISLFAYS